jgi:N-acetylglucosaminyldiphosphoundecaprenol N-acetyl-beta-D-mannosaminyltransferase
MKTRILRSNIDRTSYQLAVDQVVGWTHQQESRYICAANVHMLMEANDSPGFAAIVNDADLVTPDGIPLVWMMRLKGQRNQQRVYGPTLMLHILEAAAREYIPVGFYGSTSEVLTPLIQRLRAIDPELTVAFSFSPPFRQLTDVEDEDVIKEINQSGAKILFVGLGCPKQEAWMAAHRGRVRAVMIGVGAAFDFHAGRVSQAPLWIQKIGMEWLFRLAVEPRRLWRRYLFHNPRFIILAIADLLGLLG